MIGLNHVLTGSVIGLAVQEPLLIIPLALASHFILDSIPHFDHEVYRYGSKWFATIMLTDGFISLTALTLLIMIFPASTLAILLGATFAILPDATLLYYYTRGRPKHWLFRFHLGIQWFERPVGAMVEASYLVLISTVLVAIVW